RVRLAVDRDGSGHLAWWTATNEKGVHGYVVVRNGNVESRPLLFEKSPVDREEFDLGMDFKGRALLAYKADLPKDHADARKLHIRRLDGKGWTEPELVGGEGEELFGMVRVVGTGRRTLVSWVAREETKLGGGILVSSVRRLAVTDGTSWSPSRPL